jgi:crossover junction endodeoxyribonuclease RuvC
MNPPIILGCDPGLTGAIAALDNATGALLWVEDMPVVDRLVNAAELADWLRGELIHAAAVEQVASRPGQGVASTFKFGQTHGTLLGVLGALSVPVVHVTPAKWKRTFGLTSDKERSRRMAIELWPTMAGHFARKRDDGRAEAALIARWCWLEQRRAAA